MANNIQPSLTPNVVVGDPNVRRIMNLVYSIGAALLGTAIVVDAASDAFDISAWTEPISAGVLYLGTVLGLAVTLPNIPSKVVPEPEATNAKNAEVEVHEAENPNVG